jgi:hypothetical protein
MSPTQAREVIEAAAERIAEWEDRLRITNGDGVEVWDSPNGQMVAVAPAGAPAPPPEPLEFVPVLWADIGRTTSVEAVYVIGEDKKPVKVAEGYTVIEQSGLVPLIGPSYLNSGEYGGQGENSLAAFNNPNATVQTPGMPAGYSSIYYAGTLDLAPFGPDDLFSIKNAPVLPKSVITAGAFSSLESIDEEQSPPNYQGTTSTTIGMSLSIRGYSPSYVLDRQNRGLPIEYNKGLNIGSYILVIRQDDASQGPSYTAIDADTGLPYLTASATAAPVSRYLKIGFQPTVAGFFSAPVFRGGSSGGSIGVVAYRKV